MTVEGLISWVLRAGVLTGAALASVGYFASSEVAWIGVLALILTPFLRVMMAGIYFLMKRDLAYFGLAAYVIMMLVIGSFLHMI
ncbi:MAG: DUF1634 domain-containing protein [Candidatus Verstraetearchaeota archaeon]|nr:DUF1634 domain-containing protein [Candidatus Verstraetearchaeota archaeon]